jgi:transcription elongation GreA/GreB family factor
MKDELDFLWRKDRPVVTQQVFGAAKLVDRSGNAEFTEFISKIYFYYSIMTCSNIISA